MEPSQERKDSVVKPPSTKPMIGGKKEPFKPSLAKNTYTPSYNPSAPSAVYNPPPVKPLAVLKTISQDSKNITEEELDDENSVKDGSYMDSKNHMDSHKMSSQNQTLTQQDITPRDRNNAYAGLNTDKMITGKKTKINTDRSHSDASKYSAVVFTNPVEYQISPPKNEPSKAKTESEEDYSEDDFDDDFEPYETSNEEDEKPSGPSGEQSLLPKSKEAARSPVMESKPSPTYSKPSPQPLNINVKQPLHISPKKMDPPKIIQQKKEDEEEMKDKVGGMFDQYDSATEQLPRRVKSRGSSSVKRLKPQSYQPLNKFSPPPKKKINHFQIPKNINPL